MKVATRKIETMTLRGHCSKHHINEGECGEANKCMYRLSVESKLRELEPSVPNHHTRVDAGHVLFNFRGHRWKADTPKVAKHSLIAFDGEAKARRAAKRQGEVFESKVKPFDWRLTAVKGSKLEKTTAQRKDQINQARRRRAEAGQKPKRYTLHKRVVGFA